MKLKCFFVFSLLSVIMTSCRTPRFIYSPAPPNNPYFREKGESKLAAYYSTGGNANELASEYNNGFDLQAAYSIANNVALTADYFKRNEKDAIYDYDRAYFDSSVVRYSRHLTNFGIGYFTPILADKAVVFSVYGGLGLGKFSFIDNGIDNGNNYTRYYNSDITKWYLQSSLNVFTKGSFRTGFIGKISWVHYNNISTSYTTDELNFLALDRLPGRTLSFFEATWDLQVSFKNMNWMFIDGSITASTDPFDNNTINLEARNFNASIGLSIDFSNMKKK